MAAVGAYLRALRERQGVSIDEIARSTRVLHHYLEALESDDLASLPAPVFAKGFIRAYCQALGVPADEAITLYEQRAVHSERRPVHLEQRTSHVRENVKAPPAPLPPPPSPPTLLPPPAPAQQARTAAIERRDNRSRGAVLISFVLLVVMGAALYAVTLALQSGRDEVDGATATQVAATPAVEPVQALTPEPATSEPAHAPVAASGAIASTYRLVARTTETTWIRVRTEDGRTTEETIPPNEVREWVSNGPFVLTIGNAGGVSFELNGRPVPRLGASGAVISRMVLPADGR